MTSQKQIQWRHATDLYLGISALSGMVIAIMVVANTLLGQATTMGVSLLVNHIIGLTLLSAILLLGRRRPAIKGPGKRHRGTSTSMGSSASPS